MKVCTTLLNFFSPEWTCVCDNLQKDVYKGKFLYKCHINRCHLQITTSKMKHYLALVLLAALMTVTLQMTEQELKAVKGKFCGKNLSDMLSLVCNGVYNTKPKRTMYRNEISSREDHEDLEPIDYSEDPIVSFPFQSKQRAKSIIPMEFRKRGVGVASECCHKPCSLWEMYGYCGDQ